MKKVGRHHDQREFVARGLASLNAAKRSGRYVGANVVLGELQIRLDNARRCMRATVKHAR